MRVLVTGLIAGLEDRNYIRKTIGFYNITSGPYCNYINIIDGLEQSGNKRFNKLLSTNNYLFQVIREREYLRTGYIMSKVQNFRASIIRTPATMLWNGVSLKFKDAEEIQEFIEPDVVVTLIDADQLIKKRIEEYNGNNEFLLALKNQHYTVEDILAWMNEEVSIAEDWAKILKIPHYVVPIHKHEDVLYKLLKYGADIPSFYVSYSMTYSGNKSRKDVDVIIDKLRDYGVVIDPQGIEIDKENDTEIMKAYTVHRDLHWFVGKVDSIVAILPFENKPPLSPGVQDELGHARDYLKDRYLIFPPDNVSPFLSHSYVERDKIFQSAEDFFKHIVENGMKKLC